MFIIPIILVILVALVLSLKKNGIGSFVTLGIFGAAIYSIPAIVDTQLSLASRAVRVSNLNYVSVAPRVEAVVLIAWVALLIALLICVTMFPKRISAPQVPSGRDIMPSVARASAVLAVGGIVYLAYDQGSLLFFLEARSAQNTGAIATLWRWTAVMGLVSSLLARSRNLLFFHGIVLFLIFMRGDRTFVAIATAALIAVASYRDAKWWTRLRPMQFALIAFASGVVFLGKTLYLSAKASITGEGVSRFEYSLKTQLLYQFEPLATFSHLEFVMRSGLSIGIVDFFKSVVGNVLLVPSYFGVSTNLYNTEVTSRLSAAHTDSGIAGNYLAHGYVVGGALGAAFFYFILPFLLTMCDSQFRKRLGTVKVFWCCVGAVFAFYIHRNGLDNEFSFVRQIFITSVLTALFAAALRWFSEAGAPIKSTGIIRPLRPRPADAPFTPRKHGKA